jgi:O-phosphoseryl-tRNA(Cys) synthetase
MKKEKVRKLEEIKEKIKAYEKEKQKYVDLKEKCGNVLNTDMMYAITKLEKVNSEIAILNWMIVR